MKLNLFFTISVLSYGVAALSLKPQEPQGFAQDGMLTSAQTDPEFDEMMFPETEIDSDCDLEACADSDSEKLVGR